MRVELEAVKKYKKKKYKKLVVLFGGGMCKPDY